MRRAIPNLNILYRGVVRASSKQKQGILTVERLTFEAFEDGRIAFRLCCSKIDGNFRANIVELQLTYMTALNE